MACLKICATVIHLQSAIIRSLINYLTTHVSETFVKNNFIGLIGAILLVSGSLISVPTMAEEEQSAPAPPDTEIHLFDIGIKDGEYVLHKGRNISNNKGYDNQPFFTDKDQSILFVSVKDGKQSDVYEYHLETSKLEQITNTEHSEYSPKTYAANNKVTFVSEGGNPYQTVWAQDRKDGNSQWLLNSKEPVGYYATNEKTSDVLFWSRYGWSVQYLNLEKNMARFVSGNALPSSPQRVPNSDLFSFVHRQTNSEVWIKVFDPKDFSITPIAPIYDANYEYSWAPNGDILRFKDNRIQVWPHKSKGYRWQNGQDLSDYFKGKAGRLKISHSGKHAAVVENR